MRYRPASTHTCGQPLFPFKAPRDVMRMAIRGTELHDTVLEIRVALCKVNCDAEMTIGVNKVKARILCTEPPTVLATYALVEDKKRPYAGVA